MGERRRRYEGQAVIVTGASSGIGLATAVAFGREGARVALAAPSRESGPLESAAARVREAGGEALVVPTDVTDSSATQALANRALSAWGRIDVLVNNAGLGYHGPFETMSMDDLEKVMQVNLLGAARCLHAVVPAMLRQGSGRIVNIVSAHSRRAHPRYAAYAASKYGLRGLSDSLRVELAPHGISVTSFCPPYTETAFFENVLHSTGSMKPRRAGASADEVAAQVLDAAWRRRREVMVTAREKLLSWGNVIAPGLIDALVERRYEAKLRSGQ